MANEFVVQKGLIIKDIPSGTTETDILFKDSSNKVITRNLSSIVATNTYDNTLFVHKNGDNSTAIVGDFGHPWASIEAAFDYAATYTLINPVIEVWPYVNADSNTLLGVTIPSVSYDYVIRNTITITYNCSLHLKSGVKIIYQIDSPGSNYNYPLFIIDSASKFTITSEDKNSSSIEQLTDLTTGTAQYIAYVTNGSSLYIENISLYCDPQYDISSIIGGIKCGRDTFLSLRNVIYTMSDKNCSIAGVPNVFAQFIAERNTIVEINDCVLKMIYGNNAPNLCPHSHFVFLEDDGDKGHLRVFNTKLVSLYFKPEPNCVSVLLTSGESDFNIIWDNNYAYVVGKAYFSEVNPASPTGFSMFYMSSGVRLYIYYVARSVNNYDSIYSGFYVECSGVARSNSVLINPSTLYMPSGFGLNESYSLIAPCNVDVCNNLFVIPLISTGTGEGVSTLQLTVNAPTTIYINGAGKFYDDAAGTINEGTTRTLTSGATRTVYLKVASGVCNITCVNGNTQITQFDGWASSTNAASINLLNLSSLPAVMTYFVCYGNNTITGNLSSLPSVMTVFSCTGSNTITGNLSSLPAGITYFNCQGSNTITGNLSGIPAVMTTFLCYGSNTITGNLSSLPSVMTVFTCAGSNTITGNLSSLPSVMTVFTCAGSNTITGNLSSLPAGITYFDCSGFNTIADYTAWKDWANLMNTFYFVPSTGGGLDATEIDDLIIDLNNGNTWSGSKTLYLKGTNAAPTLASLAARNSLISKGVTITTN